ncbi:hypothetical protein Tco_0056344 [Tanacetum coccineum]
MMYNWIMRRKLDPREDPNRGVSNFTERIKGMHIFVGKFTYVIDFIIVEDISSIIDPRLSQVVLGRPFVEMSNMTHDPTERVVRFSNGNDKVAGNRYSIKGQKQSKTNKIEHENGKSARNQSQRRIHP